MENKPESTLQYNRILLKISGESLMGERHLALTLQWSIGLRAK